MLRSLILLVLLFTSVDSALAQQAAESAAPKLLLAFSSVRERRAPPYPKVYFYEHDGVSAGQLLGSIDSITNGTNFTRADMHPSLSRDGRFCAFSAQYGVTDGGRIEIWDRTEKKLLPFPAINDFPNVHQMTPSISGDASLVTFSAYARPGGSPRWGLFLYDLTAKKFLDLPKPVNPIVDERLPAISGDGRFVAFASNARGGVGLTDIYLLDLKDQTLDSLPEMNSKNMDLQPSLSSDGRLLAFSSDRPGGAGGRDIFLFDRLEKTFLPLAGLNSVVPEQSPSLSGDGRYLAFVSERLDGAGERDVYLYDREKQSLVPTPNLNSKEDDYDACVVVLPTAK
ncbi:MAG: OmpA/MotB domain protein [Planctomycetota bacterium]|nr:MAG: OmpA/MotB domain protein [Planctomycetota bacterium]